MSIWAIQAVLAASWKRSSTKATTVSVSKRSSCWIHCRPESSVPLRIALGIEYDGTGYNGWQRQRSGTGVQELVERALSSVADHPVEVTCAGRTDAGVHASGQVVHFDTTADRSMRGWLLGINSNLPDDINGAWGEPVDDDFHARFSATARHYRYRIFNRLMRSALHRNRAWWVYPPLDTDLMQKGAEHLLGQHDFSAFRAAGCQASTPTRTVSAAKVSRDGDWVVFEISANAFLQHMVRNIMGTLVSVGSGEQDADWVADVLASRDRKAAGIAAPARGLTLIGVDYPDPYRFPVSSVD